MKIVNSFSLFSLVVCIGLISSVFGQEGSEDLLRTIEALRNDLARSNDQVAEYQRHSEQLQMNLNNLEQERIPTLERQLSNDLRVCQEQKESEIANIRNVCEESKRTELDSLKNVFEQEKKIEIEQQVNSCKSQMSDVEGKCGGELEACQQQKTSLKEESEKNFNDCQKQKTDLEKSSSDKLSQCQNEVSTLTKNYDDSQKAVEDEKKSCETQIGSWESKHRSLQSTHDGLQKDLNKLKEETIPGLESKFKKDLTTCQKDGETKKQEEITKRNEQEKDFKEQIKLLEEQKSSMSDANTNLSKELEKYRTQLEDSKEQYYTTRQELFDERKNYRKLKHEVDTTLFYFNVPLFQQYCTNFYKDSLEPTVGPLVSKSILFYDETIQPLAQKAFQQVLQTLGDVQEKMAPHTKKLIQTMEEKGILAKVQGAKKEVKKLLNPYHKKFVGLLRQGGQVVSNYIKLQQKDHKRNIPDIFLKTANYVYLHPTKTAILYYKLAAIMFFYIVFTTLFFGRRRRVTAKKATKKRRDPANTNANNATNGNNHVGVNGSAQPKQRSKGKKGNKQSSTHEEKMQNLYQMESTKGKEKKRQ